MRHDCCQERHDWEREEWHRYPGGYHRVPNVCDVLALACDSAGQIISGQLRLAGGILARVLDLSFLLARPPRSQASCSCCKEEVA